MIDIHPSRFGTNTHGCLGPCPLCKQGCTICHPCNPDKHKSTPSNTQHNGEDELREKIREIVLGNDMPTHFYSDAMLSKPDQIMQLIHQREQALTKSLLAEVEERVIGVNEPEDAEDCKWGYDFNAGNRNELRFGQRQTLKAIRQERLGTKEENLKNE